MLVHTHTDTLRHTHAWAHTFSGTQARTHTNSGTHIPGTHARAHAHSSTCPPPGQVTALQSSAPCWVLHTAPIHPRHRFRMPPLAFLPLVRGPWEGRSGPTAAWPARAARCVFGLRGRGCLGSLPAPRAARLSQRHRRPLAGSHQLLPVSPHPRPGRFLQEVLPDCLSADSLWVLSRLLVPAGRSSDRVEASGRDREGTRGRELFAHEPRPQVSRGPSPAEGRPGLPSLQDGVIFPESEV